MAKNRNKGQIERLLRRGNVFCPLCLGLFRGRGSKFIRKPTLEHVPPKSLGGKVLCLTCEDCNNGTGSTIEAFLENNLRGEFTVLHKNDEGDTTARLEGPMEVRGSTSGKREFHLWSRVFPDDWNQFCNEAAGKEATLRMYPPNKERAYRFFVKSAYLALGCATTGHVWELPWMDPIRKFILDGGLLPSSVLVSPISGGAGQTGPGRISRIARYGDEQWTETLRPLFGKRDPVRDRALAVGYGWHDDHDGGEQWLGILQQAGVVFMDDIMVAKWRAAKRDLLMNVTMENGFPTYGALSDKWWLRRKSNS